MERIFTNSEFSAYQDCPQKWDFKYQQLLDPKKENEHLTFGRLIHSALDLLYTKGAHAAVYFIMEEKSKAIVSATQDTDYEKIEEQYTLAESMIKQYDAYRGIADDFTVEAVEKDFIVAIPTPAGNKSNKFRYRFRPDALLRRHGKLWLHEFKTTSSITNDYIANLALDEQVNRYCWAIEEALKEEVYGVVYTVLRKAIPKEPRILKSGDLSKDKSQGTTYDMYWAEIMKRGLNPADYTEILEALRSKENSYIYREDVIRNAQQKKDTASRLYTLASTMCTNAPIWKCPSRDCGWKCPYRSLCIEDTDTLRELSFVKRTELHPEYMEGK